MRKKQNKPVYMLALAILLVGLGCDEDDGNAHPMAGTYDLTNMTVIVSGTSNVDTVAYLIVPTGGVDSVNIMSGDLVRQDTTIYSSSDSGSIEGTAILESDWYASLAGKLPTNISTPCNPLIIMFPIGAKGEWSLNEATGSFNMDFANDLLDINGSYTYVDSTGYLEINYSQINPTDTLGIITVSLNSTLVDINKICLPVTTITERTMELIKQD